MKDFGRQKSGASRPDPHQRPVYLDYQDYGTFKLIERCHCRYESQFRNPVDLKSQGASFRWRSISLISYRFNFILG